MAMRRPGRPTPTRPGGMSGWLLHFHGPAAYALVGFLAFAEASLMVGFFIPGETAVVIGGVLAGLGRVNLLLMMAVVVVCAIAGDSVGFEVGKRSGPWLLERRPLKGSAGVRRTLVLLERYGGPAVFFGRFVAFARAIIPGLAGMSGLRYRVFLVLQRPRGPGLGGRLHPAGIHRRACRSGHPDQGGVVVVGRRRGCGRRRRRRASDPKESGATAAGRPRRAGSRRRCRGAREQGTAEVSHLDEDHPASEGGPLSPQ